MVNNHVPVAKFVGGVSEALEVVCGVLAFELLCFFVLPFGTLHRPANLAALMAASQYFCRSVWTSWSFSMSNSSKNWLSSGISFGSYVVI
jgi:hypothetical protein